MLGSLKVLFITNMWPDAVRPWHGPYVKRLADSLEAEGVDVTVDAIQGYSDRNEYAHAARRALALNRDCPYDVIHGHYGHAGVVGRLQFRAPLVITYWGSDLLGKATPTGEMTRKSLIEARVFRQLPRFAAATITQSAQMHERLPASCRERDTVLPAGIELERFRPRPQDEARRELGWPLGEKVVLFAGNPDLPVKNHPLAEAAHARLAARVDGTSLRVAWGNPPDMVPLFMSAADVLLLPSRTEGSPNVVKEAMAAELPVVATPVGDVRELLTGVAGCAVCEPDPDALAAGLEAALAHGRSPAAREAVTPLDIAAVAKRTIAIYEAARERGRRSASRSHSPQRDGD